VNRWSLNISIILPFLVKVIHPIGAVTNEFFSVL